MAALRHFARRIQLPDHAHPCRAFRVAAGALRPRKQGGGLMAIRNDKAKSKSSRVSAQPGRPRSKAIEEMIRVDHAGAYGAVRLYEGQRAVFRALPHKQEIADALARMAKDEEVHLARFNEIVNERGVRPTAFAPVWHVAGFALGAA